MAAVISVQIVEGAAAGGCFEAGKALHGTGRVTGLEAVDFGASGLVADGSTTRDVWVGIRHRFLVGECDCAGAVAETTSDGYLQAAADGEADGPELCAHAVAVALAAIGARLPWAPAPAGHQPRHLPITRHFTTPPPPLDITTVFPELSVLAATTVRLHPRAGRPGMRDSSLGGPLLWPASEPWPVCTRRHLNQELVEVPREITSWDGADAWAAALDPRARVSRYSRRLNPGGQWGPSTAVIDYSGPPDPPSPLISQKIAPGDSHPCRSAHWRCESLALGAACRPGPPGRARAARQASQRYGLTHCHPGQARSGYTEFFVRRWCAHPDLPRRSHSVTGWPGP